MMDKKSVENRKAYARPELTVFGSVRNLTGGSLGNVGDAGVMNMQQSDRRCKENIQRVGTHPAGFGLYLFDYKAEFQGEGGPDRQFGVMADEVEAVMPSAVARDASGYARVDYARLGIVQA